MSEIELAIMAWVLSGFLPLRHRDLAFGMRVGFLPCLMLAIVLGPIVGLMALTDLWMQRARRKGME